MPRIFSEGRKKPKEFRKWENCATHSEAAIITYRSFCKQWCRLFMSHQSDWIYYKQPIKFLVFVAGTCNTIFLVSNGNIVWNANSLETLISYTFAGVLFSRLRQHWVTGNAVFPKRLWPNRKSTFNLSWQSVSIICIVEALTFLHFPRVISSQESMIAGAGQSKEMCKPH